MSINNLVVAALVGLAPVQYQKLQNNPQIDKIMQATVTVAQEKQLLFSLRQIHVLGSGVIVKLQKDRKLVAVTAWHVARHLSDSDNGQPIIRIFISNKIFELPVAVLAKDEQHDLALIVTTEDWYGPDISAPVAKAPPRRGDSVWAAGTPDGREQSLTHGVLVTEVPCENNNTDRCYVFDAAIYYGNSGGGVFDGTGKLVGVALFLYSDSFKDRDGSNHDISQPGAAGMTGWYTLFNFLRDNLGQP